MAGDLGIRERVMILPDTRALGAAAPAIETDSSRRVVHMYGSRVVVMEASPADDVRAQAESMQASAAELQSLSEEERLGYGAYLLRESARTNRQRPPAHSMAKAGMPVRGCPARRQRSTTGELTLARWRKPKRRPVSGSPTQWRSASSSSRVRART